jgi:hypothetical protein
MHTRKCSGDIAESRSLASRVLYAVGLTGLLLTLAGAVGAATVATVQVDGIAGGLINETKTVSGEVAAVSGTGGTTFAAASAVSTAGLLTVTTQAGSTAISNINSTTSANAGASARWSDSIMIDAGAGLLGTSGYITAFLDFSGIGGGTASPASGSGDTAGTALAISVYGPGYSTGPTPTTYSANISSVNGSVVNFVDPIADVLVSIPVVFGFGLSIGYQLDAFVQSSTNTWYGPPC